MVEISVGYGTTALPGPAKESCDRGTEGQAEEREYLGFLLENCPSRLAAPLRIKGGGQGRYPVYG